MTYRAELFCRIFHRRRWRRATDGPITVTLCPTCHLVLSVKTVDL